MIVLTWDNQNNPVEVRIEDWPMMTPAQLCERLRAADDAQAQNVVLLESCVLAQQALDEAQAEAAALLERCEAAEAEIARLQEALAFAQDQIEVCLHPPSAVTAFAELRAAFGGIFDGIDVEAFVREMRDDEDEEAP